jgi:cold shock CspA family protein
VLALDEPATLGQLALLVEIDRDEAQEHIYELQRRAIVNVEGRLTETLSLTYALTAMAREYLEKFGALDEEYTERVRRRLREIAVSDEAARAGAAALEPGSVIAESSEERAVANVLRQALRRARAGDLERARALIARARDAVPGYFESYRVGAFIESQTRPEEARRLYLEAYRLAPPQHRPVVAYWLAGHLAMNLMAPDEAEAYAQEAHDALASARTALRLGQTLMYQRRYDDADPILRSAADDATGRTKMIAETALLDLAKRRVEMYQSERQPGRALETAAQALQRGWVCSAGGVVDRKLFEAIGELVAEALLVMLRTDDLDLVEPMTLTTLREIANNVTLLSRPAVLPLWDGRLRRLLEREDLPAVVEQLLGEIGHAIEARSGRTADGLLRGEVIEFSAKKNYGFIAPLDGGEDYFFHISSISAAEDRLMLIRGAEVIFRPSEEQRDGEARPRAEDVRVSITEQARALALHHRRAVVTRVAGEYAFLEDVPTQERVYVALDALRDRRAWTRLNVGDSVAYDADFNAQGVYALPGSVVSADAEGH